MRRYSAEARVQTGAFDSVAFEAEDDLEAGRKAGAWFYSPEGLPDDATLLLVEADGRGIAIYPD